MLFSVFVLVVVTNLLFKPLVSSLGFWLLPSTSARRVVQGNIAGQLVFSMRIEDDRSLAMIDLGAAGDLLDDQVAQVLDVANGYVDLKVIAAADVEDRQDLGQREHVAVQGPKHLPGVLDQPHGHQRLDPDANRPHRHLGVMPLEHSRASQGANAFYAARLRQADLCSQLFVRQPSIILKRAQYFEICTVKSHIIGI